MKRIISLVMIFALCLSFSKNIAYAYEEEPNSSFDNGVLALASSVDIAEELQNAREGISDPNVCQEVLNSISVASNDNSDISCTVRHLGSVASGDVYVLTAASTKTTSDRVTEDNVECWISMTWIDNRGPDNEIVNVSGGWFANGRILSDRQVHYGVVQMNGAFVEGQSVSEFPDSDDFYYTPSPPLIGLSLRAYSWVDSAGYTKGIFCGVWPTILD